MRGPIYRNSVNKKIRKSLFEEVIYIHRHSVLQIGLGDLSRAFYFMILAK